MLSRWIATKAQQHTPASAPRLPQHYLLLGAAGLFTLGVAVAPFLSSGGGTGGWRGNGDPWIPAPSRTAAAAADEKGSSSSLAYPPDALPGGRDVATPYGSVRVFEWGPEDGEPVLLIHGISTPAIALGDLAHDLVARGVSNIPCFFISSPFEQESIPPPAVLPLRALFLAFGTAGAPKLAPSLGKY